MAISDRLTKLSEDITSAYKSINDLGGTIPAHKNTENISVAIDSIYNRLPKVSGTGSDITLTPTLKGRLGSVINGDTFQQTYSGKNKFNPALLSQVSNYNTYDESTGLWTTNSGNGYSRSIFYSATGGASNRDITKLVPLEANKTYTVKFYDLVNNTSYEDNVLVNYGLFKSDGTIYFKSGDKPTEYTFTTTQESYLDIRRASSSGTISFSKIQIEENSTATDFEPYVGGTSSPNPIYPQKIQCVEGIQNVEVSGKNLFDGEYKHLALWSTAPNANTTFAGNNNNYIGAYIKVNSGSTYSISRATETNRFVVSFSINEPTTNGETLVYNTGTGKKFENITVPSGYNYLFVYLSNSGESTDNINLQIEKGSTATPYQPYQTPQTQKINLGDIKLYDGDKITGTSDNWSVVRENGEVVLDGSESGWGTEGKITNYYRYQKMLSNATQSDNNLCSHFKYLFNYNQDVQHFYISSSGRLYIFSNETSLNDFKTWLSNNNIKLVYKLATPTTEPITDTNLISQLNALYNLQSNDDTTNISVEGNLPMILDVSALKG